MIRDAEIIITASAHLFRHLFERLHPIGRHRVSVQDAAQVALGHQPRDAMLPRQRDFIASLAQLRLDILKAQSLVDGSFGFGRHDDAALPQALIGQLQSFRLCDTSKLLQVRFRSRRPQQARSKMLRVRQVDR
jgi:hypothetical protein